MAEHVLEIDKLGIQFEGRWVLRDFSLSLSKGEKVTLTGVSGAGKSTVLRAVLGLVTPDEGAVKVFGTAIDGHRIWELRKYLAYVAQEPDLGIGTAREIIERPFEFKANASLRGNLSRLPDLMNKFNLAENLLDAEMSTLSGGEKQRVALVSAILLDRPIILLDEASSALDKDNKQAVAAFFQQASGLTVLSVSHDTEWQSFSNRVIELPGSRGAN